MRRVIAARVVVPCERTLGARRRRVEHNFRDSRAMKNNDRGDRNSPAAVDRRTPNRACGYRSVREFPRRAGPLNDRPPGMTSGSCPTRGLSPSSSPRGCACGAGDAGCVVECGAGGESPARRRGTEEGRAWTARSHGVAIALGVIVRPRGEHNRRLQERNRYAGFLSPLATREVPGGRVRSGRAAACAGGERRIADGMMYAGNPGRLQVFSLVLIVLWLGGFVR